MTLAERVVAIHRALAEARLEHAFGGALALAFWTLDPRGTSDIDVNVFCPSGEPQAVLEALPAGISWNDKVVDALARDGQTRLWWNETPVDLFLDYAPIHAQAARNMRSVPFAGETIPVLGPVELTIFKAMFDRTRDWADIEAMLAAGNLDVDAVREQLIAMVGEDDSRLGRLREAIARADQQDG